MLTKWKIFNFKSIREETELDLAPLTIFAGANSSGKSTFIQSILLIAQTLSHKVGSRSVVLNGALASLGQFDDLKSNDSSSDQITIKCNYQPFIDNKVIKYNCFIQRNKIHYNQIREIDCEISFDADISSPYRDLFQIQPRLFATRLSCLSRDEDNVDQKTCISIHRSTNIISKITNIYNSDEIDDRLRPSLDYAVEIDDRSMDEIKEEFYSAKTIGCTLRHFLPESIVCAIDKNKEKSYAITKALKGELIPFNKRKEIILSTKIIDVLRDILKDIISFDQTFIDKDGQEKQFWGSDSETLTINSWREKLYSLPEDKYMNIDQILYEHEELFDRIYQAMKTSTAESEDAHDVVQTRLPHLLSEATRYLDNFFSSALKYLGPLRDAPKPVYPLVPAADPNDVGIRGEHTAYILELHKNKRIRYIPSANFKEPVVDRKTVIRTLESAVIDWLQYLGVANTVKSRDRGKLGHELKVGLGNSGSLHDLTHVGVGVSQVLPILVMCLLADTDSTLVFEQPELHLHPKVQTLLGDFFLSMALCNKQCIIETHSEYLIDRLRFRIAAATPEKELNSQAKIYFVEKPAESSHFREVVINEYGAISDWPEGFFDQSQQQAEEILRAAAMKRKAARRNKNA